MTAVVYEFRKIGIEKQNNYIFQYVKDRKLTDIYHSHDFYELIWILGGMGKQIIDGDEMAAEQDMIVMLRPGEKHRFVEQSDDMEVVSLSVKKEEFELFANVYDARLLSRIEKSVKPLQYTAASGMNVEAMYRRASRSVSEYDCKLLLSFFLNTYISQTRCLESNSGLPPMLQSAIDEMQKTGNLRQGIPAFCSLSHYSQSHLARLIRKHFNLSLKQYINELRLQKARSEIILTRRSLESISEELGFQSFSHFNKIFKAKFAVTPAALRKENGTWTA